MSKFIDFVLQYNKDVEPVLERLFKQEEQESSQIDPKFGQLVDDYQEFLGGGKKLRGTLVTFGYEMSGGKDKDLVLQASLIMEIVHTFFLVHDDIMDRDELRRGSPTMHVKYSKEFGEHFGISKAITLGDIGMFFAYKLLFTLPTAEDIKNTVGRMINQVFLNVGYGQVLDIVYEQEKNFTEDAVLKIHRFKTAHYTISGPLTMGAILAGAKEENLEPIKQFGVPIGVAFQLRDDELGMFSSEEVLGKPVDSDLKEGKMTVLIVKALEKAQGEDLEFLKQAHGNQNLTPEEVERVREIMKKTGAVEYSQALSKKLVEEGKQFIPQITNDPAYRQLLEELADFVIERNS